MTKFVNQFNGKKWEHLRYGFWYKKQEHKIFLLSDTKVKRLSLEQKVEQYKFEDYSKAERWILHLETSEE